MGFSSLFSLHDLIEITSLVCLDSSKKVVYIEKAGMEESRQEQATQHFVSLQDDKERSKPRKHVTFAPAAAAVSKIVKHSSSCFLKATALVCCGNRHSHSDPVSAHNSTHHHHATFSKTENVRLKSILKRHTHATSLWTDGQEAVGDDHQNLLLGEARTLARHANGYDPSQPTAADQPSPGLFRENSKFASLDHQLLLLKQQQQQQQQHQHCTYRILDDRKFYRPIDSSYLLPCDEVETDRLRHLHYMLRFAIQGNYLAPVNDILRKGASVLDLGCGPGVWSMDISENYPKSIIIGVDIALKYSKENKPDNCLFYECNLLKQLPFEDCTFEYIFIRFMGQAIESSQWTNILSEAARILKPYGWIEWIEKDYELHRPGPHTLEFNQRLLSLMRENHQDTHLGLSMAKRLHEMNHLMNITSTFVSCPGGQWAGKLGQLTLQSWKAYYKSLGPLLRRSWGLSAEKYSDKLRLCWREANIHKTFENIHFCYAQKRNTPLFPHL